MERSNSRDFKDLTSTSSSISDGAFFDASQYAFFGRNITEEVELGGLEEEQDNNDLSVRGGLGDNEMHEYHLFEKDEFFFSNKVFQHLTLASTSSQSANSVEDIFDSSLNLEDTHYKEGYSEGYSDGLASGIDEGNQVGLKTGFEVGEELGFYRGCIDVWNAAILVEPTCFSSRVQKSLKQMDELLCKYPFSDPEKESATDIIDSLRSKFRAICATLNIRLDYDGYPKASGIDKSGF